MAQDERPKNRKDLSKSARLIWDKIIGHPEIAELLEQFPDQVFDAFLATFYHALTPAMADEEWKRLQIEAQLQIELNDPSFLAEFPVPRTLVESFAGEGVEAGAEEIGMVRSLFLPVMRETLRLRLKPQLEPIQTDESRKERLLGEIHKEYQFHPAVLAAYLPQRIAEIKQSEEMKMMRETVQKNSPNFPQLVIKALQLDQHDPLETLRVFKEHTGDEPVDPERYAALTENDLKMIPLVSRKGGRVVLLPASHQSILKLYLLNFKAYKRVLEAGGTVTGYAKKTVTMRAGSGSRKVRVIEAIIEFPDLGQFLSWSFGST